MELTQGNAVGEIAESCLDLLTSVNEKSKNFRQLSLAGVKLGEEAGRLAGFFQCNHEESASLDGKKTEQKTVTMPLLQGEKPLQHRNSA